MCFDSRNLIGKRGELIRQNYAVGGLHQWDVQFCLRWMWVSKHQWKPALKKKYEKNNPKLKKSSMNYSNPKSSLQKNENKALFVKLLPRYLRKADDNVNVCIEDAGTQITNNALEFCTPLSEYQSVYRSYWCFVLILVIEPGNADVYFLSGKTEQMRYIQSVINSMNKTVKVSLSFCKRLHSLSYFSIDTHL